MRLLEAPSKLLSIFAFLLLLISSRPSTATPFSKISDIIQREDEGRSNELVLRNASLVLQPRSACQAGSAACGYYGQICCITASEYCSTNEKNQAVCKAGTGAAIATGAGSWQTYTSIWIETNTVTRTSIYSSWVPGTATVAVAPGATCVPNWANNESPCGPVCCPSGSYCSGDPSQGICLNAGNGGFTTTGVGYSAPLRPTTLSNGVVTTVTIAPTTTVPFVAPVPTGTQTGTMLPAAGGGGGGGGGLSPGAIAGIVIGVLAGVALLILLCVCCCLKAGFDGILAILGLGKKKPRRRVVEEEYIETHRRQGSGSNGRWYGSASGSRPARPRPPPPAPKKSGFGGLLGATAGLGGLALALGLKRKHDKKEKSEISSSYGSSYYDYSSSASSDDRTRRSSRPSRR